MSKSVKAARQWYAEDLRFAANVRSKALIQAFATVPRERFVGRGPWRILSRMNLREYWSTADADAQHVYHDVLIALDEARGLNNGQPSLWALLFDRLSLKPGERVLHLGCGTGYYSAILAELVGPSGKVVALDLNAALIERARKALKPWPQVTVVAGDGARHDPGKVDVIVASAGATHPLPLWVDALKPGGRLLFPLTSDKRGGVMLLITRRQKVGFAAEVASFAMFFAFAGARDAKANRRLEAALAQGNVFACKSLRRDRHRKSKTCWLHGDGYCLSLLELSADGQRSRMRQR
jgi:protein-L-isoaspartate(D-aspartate) O-methyltransferase